MARRYSFHGHLEAEIFSRAHPSSASFVAKLLEITNETCREGMGAFRANLRANVPVLGTKRGRSSSLALKLQRRRYVTLGKWRDGMEEGRERERQGERDESTKEGRELFGVHGLAGRRSELYYFPSRACFQWSQRATLKICLPGAIKNDERPEEGRREGEERRGGAM